jgi:hypothetical protein
MLEHLGDLHLLRELPAQHSADPGQQFARIERLAEVVVGADFEPNDAIDILLQCRQQDDRSVPSAG